MDSIKVGAGIGLVLMVAASKRELDKMVELRTQMEEIVENAKEELGRTGTVPVCEFSSQSRENRTCSTTNIEEGMMGSSGEASVLSFERPSDLPYIEIDVKDCSSRGRCDKDGCVMDGMAELEAELETELQRLELQLESEDISR